MRTFIIVVLLAACGSDGSTPGTDTLPADSLTDTLSDGPGTDGTGACAPGDLYVTPCCGGALPMCIGMLDAGGCPPGTVEGQCWGDGSPTIGCTTTCTPPPPFCAPAGTDCNTACMGYGYLDPGTGTCACACA